MVGPVIVLQEDGRQVFRSWHGQAFVHIRASRPVGNKQACPLGEMGDMVGAIVSGTQAVGRRSAPAGRVCAVPGGESWMGSNDFYEEERPLRRVRVEDFRIDECPVTNDEFAAFVADTGYVTYAEIPPAAADYPGAPADCTVAPAYRYVNVAHRVPVCDPKISPIRQ